MNVLLTGATGFVGSRLAMSLKAKPDLNLTLAVRRSIQHSPMRVVEVRSLDAKTDWSAAVTDQEVVIHTAARAHILENEAGVPLNEYRRVNVEGTLNLAEQAAEAGARRFIFISSIGVNGLTSLKPFTEKDIPNPVDPYAKSKYEAEVGLFKLLKRSQMELVVIRPPLVYGPNAPGNFGRLVRWVCKPIPLPLGAVNNKRTLISLDNLIDLIMTCVNHPRAANQVFLAGDGQDLSTTELLVGVARAAGVPSRLVATPSSLLMLGAFLLGKKPMAQRLLCSLQIDIRKSRHLLDWKPPLTVEEGLRRCFDENKKE